MEFPDDPRMRQWAAVALGFCGDPVAVPKLIRALEDPSPLVRNKAALALGELRDPQAIGPLLEMARRDIWYNAVCARNTLRRLGR
jgi:HEAT repeat protein